MSTRSDDDAKVYSYLAAVISHLFRCRKDLIEAEDWDARWNIHAILGHDFGALRGDECLSSSHQRRFHLHQGAPGRRSRAAYTKNPRISNAVGYPRNMN